MRHPVASAFFLVKGVHLKNLASWMWLAAAACGSVSAEDQVSWSYIHAAIVVPNCATAGCHSTLTRTRGIDLENKDTAYAAFAATGLNYNLDLLIEGKVPSYYRMPPDQPLPQADIDLILRWIAAGKPDN